MAYPGRIESVHVTWNGGQVTANAAIGATVIPVAFPVDFDENGGSLMRVPADPTVTDSTVYAYTGIDLDAETVTLAAALTVAWSEADRLLVWPLSTETRALVRLADSMDEPAADCRVVHALRPLLADGVRDPDTGESVFVDSINGEWVVTDLAGQSPAIQGVEVLSDGSLELTPGNFGTGPEGAQNASALLLPVDGTPTWTDNQNGVWTLGTQTKCVTAAQDFGNTALTAIPNLSIYLPPGSYRIHMYLNGACSTVAGVTFTPGFLFSGGAMSSINFNGIIYMSTGEGASPVVTTSQAITSLTGFGPSPAAPGTISRNTWGEFWGFVTVSTAGTLQAAIKSSTSGDNFHLQAGCVLEVTPA